MKRPLSIVLCQVSPYNLSNVLGLFQSFCEHEIFIMLNLPILLVLVRQREKSQKYLSLLAFNWNLNHSNLRSTFGAINLLKWELFSGSPGSNKGRFCNTIASVALVHTSIQSD